MGRSKSRAGGRYKRSCWLPIECEGPRRACHAFASMPWQSELVTYPSRLAAEDILASILYASAEGCRTASLA
eukprot:254589-Amphidinium_carterae.2